MAAGIETLKLLSDGNKYGQLEETAAELAEGLERTIGRTGVAARVARIGSLFTVFFSSDEVADYDAALRADTAKYRQFFWSMLEAGVYLPPSQFEACFLSLAHTKEDVEATLKAAEAAFGKLAPASHSGPR